MQSGAVQDEEGLGGLVTGRGKYRNVEVEDIRDT
jgi:hypothetical protein